MKEIININSIASLHDFFGLDKPKHPLISVLRVAHKFEDIAIEKFRYSLGMYHISLKDTCPFVISNYGRNSYDFTEGSMMFIAPNQTMEFKKQQINRKDKGWTIVFHPDLIRKSELGQKIEKFSFFSYASNEALHVSEDERKIVSEITDKIEREFHYSIDVHSQNIIISNLELLLNYCVRFYDRQFYTRTNLNKDIANDFILLLKEYYQSKKQLELGVPTVQYCAENLNISSKYLSDLLRKETGKGTQDHIHQYVIEQAKNKLLNSKQTASEIAYFLGFEYPQYFSKFFKKKTSLSPNEYRKSLSL